MPDKNIHKLSRTHSPVKDVSAVLKLVLYSASDDNYHPFLVSPQMKVAAFLELALERLSQGEGAHRVEALRSYYQPVLELWDEEQELPQHVTLADAGIVDGAICRIAARPRKERIMFCSYG